MPRPHRVARRRVSRPRSAAQMRHRYAAGRGSNGHSTPVAGLHQSCKIRPLLPFAACARDFPSSREHSRMLLSQGSDPGTGRLTIRTGKKRPSALPATAQRAAKLRSCPATPSGDLQQGGGLTNFLPHLGNRATKLPVNRAWREGPLPDARWTLDKGWCERGCRTIGQVQRQIPWRSAATDNGRNLNAIAFCAICLALSAGKKECKSYFCPFPVLATTLKTFCQTDLNAVRPASVSDRFSDPIWRLGKEQIGFE